MRPFAAQLLAAAMLGIAGGAEAAEWSTPLTISDPHTFASPLTVVQGPQSVLATWGWQDGTGAGARTGFGAAEAPLGSNFGAERPAPDGIVDVGAYGVRRAVALTQKELPARRGRPLDYRLGVAFADRGRFGRLHRLADAPVLSRAAIASNGGVVIVGWVELDGRRRIVKVVTRHRGRAFSRPVIVSGLGQAEQVEVAANRRGDLVVAFVRNTKVLARLRRAGAAWGPTRELARAGWPTKWQLSAAIADNGRVAVAWRRYTLRHDDVAGTRSLESAYAPAGATRFSSPQTVAVDGVVRPNVLAIGSTTAFALSWTDQDGIASNGSATAMVAVTGGSPRFGAPLAASGAIGGLRDVRVAAGALGLYVVWVEPRPNGNGDGIGRGALLPPGAPAFLAAEQITPNENVHEVAIAADVPGRAFVAVWSARPSGTGPGVPIAEVESVIRAARRIG